MGHRQSRLSADSSQRSRRSPPAKKTVCPGCFEGQLYNVDVDGELQVCVCDGCGRSYGVDDSMDADLMCMLLMDEELCRGVQMSLVSCESCLNNDPELFVIDDVDQKRIQVRCLNCYVVSNVALKDWINRGADDAWVSDILPTEMNGTTPNHGRSQWNGDYNQKVVDSNPRNIECKDLQPFSCRCGNNEVDCFQQYFDVDTGDLSRVKCLACEEDKELDAPFCIECWHCGNDTNELFEKLLDDFGRLSWLRCLKCQKRLCLPGQAANGKKCEPDRPKARPSRRKSCVHDWRRSKQAASRDGLGWTKLTDLRDVRRADHVAWHKWYAIWHHAIVVDVPAGGRALTLIHYHGSVAPLDGHLASVRLETIDVDLNKENLYRIDYPGCTYPVDEVVQRASDRLGEAKYNPFTNNCEHFARWCKTGRSECGQVRKFTDRVGLVARNAVNKAAVQQAVAAVAPTEVGAGLNVVRSRVGTLFGVTPGAVRNMKCGALACTVAVNFALEGALFAREAHVFYRKYKSGTISLDELRRKLCQLGSECTGGLVAGTACGILGQILIPVPFIGGLVGTTLGSLIGRYAGAVIGNQIARAAIKQ